MVSVHEQASNKMEQRFAMRSCLWSSLCCYEGLQMGSPPERWCLCLCMMITWPSEAVLQLCLLICRVNFIECSLGLFVVCHLLQYACWIPSSSASWATNTCFEISGPSCICFFLKLYISIHLCYSQLCFGLGPSGKLLKDVPITSLFLDPTRRCAQCFKNSTALHSLQTIMPLKECLHEYYWGK